MKRTMFIFFVVSLVLSISHSAYADSSAEQELKEFGVFTAYAGKCVEARINNALNDPESRELGRRIANKYLYMGNHILDIIQTNAIGAINIYQQERGKNCIYALQRTIGLYQRYGLEGRLAKAALNIYLKEQKGRR